MWRSILAEWRVHNGEYLPPWYYALGYYDYFRHVACFYPIPVAIGVRLFRALWREWNGCRCRQFPWE